MKKLNKVLLIYFVFVSISVLINSCSAQNQVNVIDFEKYLNQKDVVLIDIRTPEEFQSGHLENAININFYDDVFKEKILKIEKNKTVLVYCRSGGRSAQASSFLRANGYKVVDMAGGISSWVSAGRKIDY